MTAKPLLSVIVPSFNVGEYLPRTVESILTQSYRPIEIVVVDGASTDGTVELLGELSARHPEVRWISEPDDGPADAVNKGLKLARGEIGAIQSADDIYYPGALEEVMRAFTEHPQHGMVYGHCNGIDLDDRVLATRTLPPFSWESFFAISICLPQSSIFFRMSLADEVGGWNPAYYGCDLDFWLRMLLRTEPFFLDRVVSGWRLRPTQRTRPEHNAEIWDGYWRMIDDSAELKTAPPRVRRLAYASRHLLAMQFHPTGDVWAIRWHILRGLLGHPTFWRYYHRDRIKRLIPGVERLSNVRAKAVRVARRVISRPR